MAAWWPAFTRGATADGINEKGLVANLLYLAKSEYPPATDTRPAVVITAWAQCVLADRQ